MKRALPILAAIALTAVVTYLAVSNRQNRDYAKRLADDLSQAEERVAELEETVRQTQARLRRALDAKDSAHPATVAVRSQLEATVATSSSESHITGQRVVASPPIGPPSAVVMPVAVPVVAALPAARWVRYETESGTSSCVLKGTSSFQDWQAEGTAGISGRLEVDARYDFDHAAAIAQLLNTNFPLRAEFSLPVRSLTGVPASAMTQVMQAALGLTSYPQIHYRLTQSTLMDVAKTRDGQRLLLESNGELAVNGATNAVRMWVTIEASAAGSLRVGGSTALRMSDFGVAPQPMVVPGMGKVKAGDEVKVRLVWGLRRSSETRRDQ